MVRIQGHIHRHHNPQEGRVSVEIECCADCVVTDPCALEDCAKNLEDSCDPGEIFDASDGCCGSCVEIVDCPAIAITGISPLGHEIAIGT